MGGVILLMAGEILRMLTRGWRYAPIVVTLAVASRGGRKGGRREKDHQQPRIRVRRERMACQRW
jgi:hypothetical protein